MTFERWRRLTRWLPPWLRCSLFHRLPRQLQWQAWRALADEMEARRLADDQIAKQRAIAEECGFSHVSELIQLEFERLRDDAA